MDLIASQWSCCVGGDSRVSGLKMLPATDLERRSRLKNSVCFRVESACEWNQWSAMHDLLFVRRLQEPRPSLFVRGWLLETIPSTYGQPQLSGSSPRLVSNVGQGCSNEVKGFKYTAASAGSWRVAQPS